MAGQARRAEELKQIAELVADAARGRSDYRPTLTDAAMADAFDAAMASIGSDLRCWRGSKAEGEQRGATKAQLAYRAKLLKLCVACSEPLSTHSREQMLTCATARS